MTIRTRWFCIVRIMARRVPPGESATFSMLGSRPYTSRGTPAAKDGRTAANKVHVNRAAASAGATFFLGNKAVPEARKRLAPDHNSRRGLPGCRAMCTSSRL